VRAFLALALFFCVVLIVPVVEVVRMGVVLLVLEPEGQVKRNE